MMPLKWLVIYDLFTMHRTDGAMVRLVTPIALGESVAAAEQRIVRFFQEAYPLLEPHVGA